MRDRSMGLQIVSEFWLSIFRQIRTRLQIDLELSRQHCNMQVCIYWYIYRWMTYLGFGIVFFLGPRRRKLLAGFSDDGSLRREQLMNLDARQRGRIDQIQAVAGGGRMTRMVNWRMKSLVETVWRGEILDVLNSGSGVKRKTFWNRNPTSDWNTFVLVLSELHCLAKKVVTKNQPKFKPFCGKQVTHCHYIHQKCQENRFMQNLSLHQRYQGTADLHPNPSENKFLPECTVNTHV